ncbi:hypothetical protein GKIL_3951 [Gloeobacter kilaueensis JS1]|uniref:Putative restriction endonuclease domain-containing protein n=2 Tax=Gloeobacter TaxID=33071 RepID=U5QMG8_GLOK1|nr:hypothetical protein GKIL_3951 [Gloeobacter kilaueensis JS1]
MIDAGILTGADTVELLAGQIVQMAPQKSLHAATLSRAADSLREQLGGAIQVRLQLPVTLLPDSEPEPDIAVVRPDSRYYLAGHPGPADILLLVEVSDSTLDYDRGQKARIYARSGIGEYWIVDIPGERLIVLREADAAGYRQESVLTLQETVIPLNFPAVSLTVAALFP